MFVCLRVSACAGAGAGAGAGPLVLVLVQVVTEFPMPADVVCLARSWQVLWVQRRRYPHNEPRWPPLSVTWRDAPAAASVEQLKQFLATVPELGLVPPDQQVRTCSMSCVCVHVVFFGSRLRSPLVFGCAMVFVCGMVLVLVVCV